MKKLVVYSVLFVAMALCTSCGLFAGAYSNGSSRAAEAMPLPRTLTLTEDPGTGLYGYVDTYGRWAIPPQFRYAATFDNEVGIAVVEVGYGRYGGINTRGQLVIQPNFTSLYDVQSAISSIANGCYCGAELWEVEDRDTELWGYLNYLGEWHIAPQYLYATDFNRNVGIAVVEITDGYYGGINTTGQIVIQPRFTSSYDVQGAIDSIIKGRYAGIDLWEERDPATGLWGYLNYNGEWHIAPQFTYAQGMNQDGFAVVEFSERRWGAINRNGQVVVQPNFNSLYDAEAALYKLIR